jgi:hypothetical protein
MPITNQSIQCQKTLGDPALILGAFSKTMLPGFVLAFIPFFCIHTVTGDHTKALPVGGSVLFAYWFYVGNDREKAWKSLSRHVEKKIPYVGSSENKSVLKR